MSVRSTLYNLFTMTKRGGSGYAQVPVFWAWGRLSSFTQSAQGDLLVPVSP